MSVNKIILIGKLGSVPDLAYKNGDTAVCKFSLATNDGYGGKEVTNWHNIVTFKTTAENCNRYLRKGSEVFIEGRQEHKSYEKDGVKKYYSQVVAQNVQFLSKKNEDGTPDKNEEGETKQMDQQFFDGGDDPSLSIPF